ncbi:MAG TPA: BlaI/MecI/CopY family transcriptional regulator [Flavisolibacter sp.]|nr:BlaI/MecI/CopY family transcriptional regulator [Flavisolibacter sp.]
MARPKTPDGEPTKGEMDILQVLWEHGPSTVRFVNDELNKEKETLYTSTLKLLQLMYEKGMVERDSSAMTHVYTAALKEDATKKAMLKRFVNNVFKGSPADLMVQLLGTKKLSKEELSLLKDLVKKIEKK